MMKYDNYIFDLYGTLIDIRTDENDLVLWKYMAELFRCVGKNYTASSMRAAYRRIWKETEKEMQSASGMEFPEVNAVEVFRKLGSCPVPETGGAGGSEGSRGERGCGASGSSIEGCRTALPEETEEGSILQAEETGWYRAAAGMFRILSRKKMRLYPETLETLGALRDAGGHLYLLSNAQHEYTIPEIRFCGLEPFFDGIMISSDEGIRKPQPEYMERLLARYHLNRECCVMIGNEPASDIRVAMACGMHSVLLNTGRWSREKVETEIRSAVGAVKRGRGEKEGNIAVPQVIMDGKISELPGIVSSAEP